jgi:hypothetical protein
MNDLSAEELRGYVDYNPATGVFVWRRRSGSTRGERIWNARYAGTVAGSSDSNGYQRLTINYRSYLAHRLAWLYVHGEWPPKYIDHIDRDRSNNRIANLRPATQSQNKANEVLRTTNTSGYRGVGWEARAGKWFAKIVRDGRQVHLGYFSDKLEAARARDAAARNVWAEFALDTVGASN